MRLIDAEPIIEKLKNAIYIGKRISADTEDLEAILANIEAQPADLSEYSDKLWKTAYERGKAEAHPKKGKWIHRKNWSRYVCEQCSFESREASRYCPNCGARMEE